MEKSDKTVADSIKAAFESKNLLKNTDLATIADKLTAGTISEQDWKLMAELSLENNEEDSNAKKS